MTENNKDFNEIYRTAVYGVFSGSREIRFRIGENNAEIEALLGEFKAERFALITAYNPRSKELPEEENLIRQEELSGDLCDAGYGFLQGYGADENDSWIEPSLFVLDISEETAVSFAGKYEQHAIVYGERGSAPQLVWCD